MTKNNDIYNKPMFTIGIVSELAGVHPQTLRSYEQKGLISPKRTDGNTRMYSQADIDRLNLINELTDEGINLAGVMRILTLQRQLDEAEDALAESTKRLNELHLKIQRLSSRLCELGPTSSHNYAIVKTDDLPKAYLVVKD